jgi:ribose transport system substrate-binding protein
MIVTRGAVRTTVTTLSAGALLLATAACGSSSSSGAGGGGGGGGGGGKSITLIAGIIGDPFYQTMRCGAQAEAKQLGVKFTYVGPKSFTAADQIPIVSSTTAAKPSAALIAPTDSKALIQPMEQMKSAGIKVVQVDTTVDDNSIAVSSVSTNNIQGGKVAAGSLGKLVGGTGSVLVVNTEPGVSTTDQRATGFNAEMKAKFPNVTVLPVQYDNDDPAKAASVVTNTLASHPNLDGLFAINVITAQGVATGLKQAGKASKVKVVGFDAGAQQVQQLKDGTVQALVAQEPYQIGVDGVEQAVNSLTGKSVTPHIGTPLFALTKDNLAANAKYEYKSTC